MWEARAIQGTSFLMIRTQAPTGSGDSLMGYCGNRSLEFVKRSLGRKKGEDPQGPSPHRTSCRSAYLLGLGVDLGGVLDVTFRHACLRIAGVLPLTRVVGSYVAGPIFALSL